MSSLEFFGCSVRRNGADFVKNAFSRVAKNFFAAGLTFISVSGLCSISAGDEKVTDPLLVSVVNIQGQDIELPEDFMVRVDGNKMQVALVSMGAISPQMSKSNLLVRLLNSNGQEKEAMTNMQGIATFTDVQPDELHAVVVVDEKAHVAVPLLTVSTQNAIKRKISTKPVRLPLIPANREEMLNSIARGLLPSSDLGGELYGVSDYKLQAVNPYSVRLQKDGNMLGRIIVADRDLAENLRYAKLTFLRDNQVVARTDSNPSDGSFNVVGLKPGVYGVIAAGPAGYSSFAFNILPAEKPARLGEGISGKPVSFVQTDPSESLAIPSDRLFVFLCPPTLVPIISDRIRQAYGQPNDASTSTQPVSGLTMAGNGGGGSSGGGGSGGGIGGIAAIAGLATVGVIAASNDSNNNSENIVVSPIAP